MSSGTDLPSGRPRRVLLLTAGLQPDDATLRAFDLARHLHAHGRAFARVVSAQDGPLRTDFEAAGFPVQVLDAPGDPAAVAREVWGRNQDAGMVFGDAAVWAEAVAQRHGWPLHHDAAGPDVWYDPYASPARRAELRATLALPAGARLALAFATETRDEDNLTAWLHAIRDAVSEGRLVSWHFGLIGAAGEMRLVSPGEGSAVAVPVPANVPRSAWVAAADAVLDAHRHGAGFRPLLDAAALAVPIVAEPSSALAGLLPAAFFATADLGSPTDVADALIDLALNPDAAARRVAAAHVFAMSRRNPARLMPGVWANLQRPIRSGDTPAAESMYSVLQAS